MDSTYFLTGTTMTTHRSRRSIILTIGASLTSWLLPTTRRQLPCSLSPSMDPTATSSPSPTILGTDEDTSSLHGKTTTKPRTPNSILGDLSQVTLISPWIPPWLSKSSFTACMTETSQGSDSETSSPTK